MSAKQRRTVGAVVKIPVDDYFVHAQILPEADMVFYNTKDKGDLAPDEVVSSKILFRAAVNHDAILDGRWMKTGKAPLSQEHTQPVRRFIQDALNPDRFEIYLGGEISPATREECVGLDRCAVWAVNHIEDRIRDHYNGVPNVCVEQLRLK